MVKASNTAEANYGLTRFFYAKTNAVYRFYGYDLIIDDALAIVYALLAIAKFDLIKFCRLHCRVKRIRYLFFVSESEQSFLSTAPDRKAAECK